MPIFKQDDAERAGPGVHSVGDVTGLYLKVGGNGAASWFYRYRLGGKRREMGLGSLKRLKLAEATRAAKKADFLRDDGIDPISERKRTRAENLAKDHPQGPTANFKRMAEQFLQVHGAEWRHKYARQAWLGLMQIYVYPVIGDLRLEQIRISHITEIMTRAREAKFPKTAHRARMRVEQVLNYAIAQSGNHLLVNPASGKLHPKPPNGERPHFRSVVFKAAPEVFQALDVLAAQHAGSLTGSALNAWLFMILCSSRPSEALGARWSEIDQYEKLWTLPGARMKSGKSHIVPLSSPALSVLQRQRTVATGDMVFPGRGGSLMSYDTFTRAPANAGLDAASPHGWRSVFRRWAGNVADDVPRDLAEAALAHSLGSVEGSYWHGEDRAVERRRKVMAQYAEWLGAAKVVSIKSRDRRRRA